MLDQAVVRTGIKFGFFGALAGFAFILILYFVGVNPYGQLSWWAFLPIPVVIFRGISSYKKQHNAELGFLKALATGLFIAVIIALLSAVLLYLLGSLTGAEPLQRHISEMKILFGKTSAEALKANVLSQKTIDETYRQIENTTLTDLVIDDFIKKFFVGFISAIIGAVFFRK